MRCETSGNYPLSAMATLSADLQIARARPFSRSFLLSFLSSPLPHEPLVKPACPAFIDETPPQEDCNCEISWGGSARDGTSPFLPTFKGNHGLCSPRCHGASMTSSRAFLCSMCLFIVWRRSPVSTRTRAARNVSNPLPAEMHCSLSCYLRVQESRELLCLLPALRSLICDFLCSSPCSLDAHGLTPLNNK